MGVRYEWADDTKLIMNLYLEQPWTWKEYNAMTDEVMPVLRELNHPCATVVDVRRMGALPRDGNVLQILLGVERTMPENIFASVIVGAPYIITVFMNMLMKLRPRASRLALFANTMEEAHARIHERYRQMFTETAKEPEALP